MLRIPRHVIDQGALMAPGEYGGHIASGLSSLECNPATYLARVRPFSENVISSVVPWDSQDR